MSSELFKRAIVLVFISVSVTSSWASGDMNDNGRTRVQDRGSRYEWKLHDLASHAPLILIGHVEQIFGFEHESMFRLFRVTIEESLKGDVRDSAIYLVEPLPSDATSQEPPVLFPSRYLLFLSPADNEEAAEDLKRIEGTNTPLHIYSVYAGWKGAVSLDSKWRERSNKKIEVEYGHDSSEEIAVAVRSVCDYMRAPSDEKKKLAEQFRRQGGVYKQFIDDALVEKVPQKP